MDDELELYKIASREFDIPLEVKDQRDISPEGIKILPLEYANQFHCFPLDMTSTLISIVTWNWLNKEIITKGIKNITGMLNSH